MSNKADGEEGGQMKAPLFLPGFVQFILNWLFFSLLREEDDFTQTLRKVTSAVLLLCTPSPVGFAVFYTYRAATGAPKYGPHVMIGFDFALGLMFIANFAYVKMTRHMSDRHADVIFVFLAVDWLFLYLSVPEFDPRGTTGAIAIVSAMARPPHMKAILCFLFVLAVVSIYNQVYRYSGYPLLLIPGEVRPVSTTEDLLTQLSALFCLSLTITGVVAQAAAHVRALAASEASVRMSNEVVVLLSEYNTDGVDEVLSSYSVEGVVNNNLIHSFRGINRNLERYRPHLPNYVLMKDEEEDGVVPPRPSSRSPSEPRRSTSASSSDSRSPNLKGRAEIALGGSSPSFRGRVSLARIDLSGLLKGGALQRETSTAFFDALFQLATAFHASVHATVGDVATVSWNATRRVVQPELKAAKYLLRLLNTARRIPGARPAAGAVFSGLASCDIVNAQASRQQAVLISAPWVDALDAAFGVAQSARCGLIDAETHATAAYEVEARAVERVQYVPTDDACYRLGRKNAWLKFDDDSVPAPPDVLGAARSTALYELVAELQRSDDEWMYQLQDTAEAQQTGSAKVTQAFEAAVGGHYGVAVALLGDWCPTGGGRAEDNVLVQRMKHRCEQMLMSTPPR